MAYPKMALAALSDPTRAAVFESLGNGPRSVADIAKGLPVSRPAVSQHLRVLEEAKLVSHRQEGTRHFYSIDLRGLAGVRTWLDGFWTHAMDSFAAEVNRQSSNDHDDATHPPS
ncbi:MAG TPA: metalloregulator ArsR/SmtB family transcription factor [Opitutaceae bacterium]|nr:metalloregulator ArsR/SmtB family transcription factor [Opitutaceae bacterium]